MSLLGIAFIHFYMSIVGIMEIKIGITTILANHNTVLLIVQTCLSDRLPLRLYLYQLYALDKKPTV